MSDAVEQRRQTTPEPASPSFVERRDWERARCRGCARTLCKHTREALRPGMVIEIKCGGCNAMNYIMGPIEA